MGWETQGSWIFCNCPIPRARCGNRLTDGGSQTVRHGGTHRGTAGCPHGLFSPQSKMAALWRAGTMVHLGTVAYGPWKPTHGRHGIKEKTSFVPQLLEGPKSPSRYFRCKMQECSIAQRQSSRVKFLIADVLFVQTRLWSGFEFFPVMLLGPVQHLLLKFHVPFKQRLVDLGQRTQRPALTS